MNIRNGQFLLGDCFEQMTAIPDGSVDMVLCDLPYGTTQNKWDSVLPLDRLWAEYWRVCKPNAAVVLTAAQPFTTVLAASQLDAFKYEWVYRKTRPSGNLFAKKRPMRAHENVLVFYKKLGVYHPYLEIANPLAGRPTPVSKSESYQQGYQSAEYVRPEFRTKNSLLEGFPVEDRGIHPTQKPVALFEYLIRTYTDPGEVVLDNTAGSGTTAIAAEQSGRRWICIERDETYYWSAVARVLEL